ncbi:MAG: hypothetical protein KDK70_26910, partial [Myxococcales bacterium]|nr:hypothetical protein [Myxococcales bacterium]
DATLAVGEARGYVALDLATFTRDDSGVRVRGVEVDGQPTAFVVGPRRLVVETGDRLDATIRVRYAGDVTVHGGGDFVLTDDVVLRGESGWLPTLPDSAGRFDVRVRLPDGYRAFGQGEATAPRPLGNGWTQWAWQLPTGRDFTLYAAPAYVTEELELAGARLLIAVWPESADALPTLVEPLRALQGRFEPLGPYPFGTANIVQTGFPGGYGALSNVTLGRDLADLTPETLLPFVAHELAHGWFPGTAIVPSDAGQWGEPFAQYAMTLVVDEALALDERRHCATAYAALPIEQDVEISTVTGVIEDWARTEAINYCKGLLVLTTLEDRVGQPAMLELLRALSRSRAGQITTWDDIVDLAGATLGAEHGHWLRAAVTTPGAPDLRLDAVQRRGSAVTGVLRQSGAAEGAVGLGLLDEQGALLRTITVPFAGPTTRFTVEDSAGAATLVLDPAFRLARRWPVDAAATAAGLRVALR